MKLSERRARRRRMREERRRQEEFDQRDILERLGPYAAAAAKRRARNRRLRHRTARVAVVGAVLGGLVAVDPSAAAQRLRQLGSDGDDRLADPVAVRTHGEHAFLNTRAGGRPVGWDPCRPIRYAVNPAGAPDGWQRLVAEAVVAVEAATGLVFEDTGTTRDRDFAFRVGGDRPAPVLIGWADQQEEPLLAGDIAGFAHNTVTFTGGRLYYAYGAIVLDARDYDAMSTEPDGWPWMRAILLHELGHLVGLDHVDDPGELMSADGSWLTDFGPGDREGLARLGAVPCA